MVRVEVPGRVGTAVIFLIINDLFMISYFISSGTSVRWALKSLAQRRIFLYAGLKGFFELSARILDADRKYAELNIWCSPRVNVPQKEVFII
jgi:hypothetical protein